MKFILTCLLSLVSAVSAQKVTTLERSLRCPIDGHEWRQKIETSSRPSGLRLDLRQLGDVVEPPTLPQCPKCNFTLFAEELDERLVERLRPFIMGTDFQMLAQKNTSYFCLAQIQEFLDARAIYIGKSYLRASWQVEDKPAINRRYLALAYDKLSLALGAMKSTADEYADTALLCGELERRLQLWEKAEQRFTSLRSHEQFRSQEFQTVIAIQLALIAQRNSGPQRLQKPKPVLTSIPAPAPESPRVGKIAVMEPPGPALKMETEMPTTLTLDASRPTAAIPASAKPFSKPEEKPIQPEPTPLSPAKKQTLASAPSQETKKPSAKIEPDIANAPKPIIVERKQTPDLPEEAKPLPEPVSIRDAALDSDPKAVTKPSEKNIAKPTERAAVNKPAPALASPAMAPAVLAASEAAPKSKPKLIGVP